MQCLRSSPPLSPHLFPVGPKQCFCALPYSYQIIPIKALTVTAHCISTATAVSGIPAQAELVTRAAKSWLPASLLPELVAAACGSGAAPEAALGANWNEAVVGLVQAALGAKPELPQVRTRGCALREATGKQGRLPAWPIWS